MERITQPSQLQKLRLSVLRKKGNSFCLVVACKYFDRKKNIWIIHLKYQLCTVLKQSDELLLVTTDSAKTNKHLKKVLAMNEQGRRKAPFFHLFLVLQGAQT